MSGSTKFADIYIWDANSKEVLANIRDFHIFAVNNLVFSPDGTLLLSSGEDVDNSIAVHSWIE